MAAAQNFNSLDDVRSKVAAAIDAFEEAYELALAGETPSANEQLSVATHELIKALAHVLISIEQS
ncbi:MAG: hypothetical protein JWL84_405 [Rhodospirillales bacterium]|jgi:hypothetical protein|nr:hypothetical protein [Rhodospirillales bacterium]